MMLVFVVIFCVIIALGFGAMAAYSDFNKLMIPNIYSLLVGAAFIPAFLAVTIFSPDISFFGSWKNHVFSFSLMFAITYGLFHFKLIGGGDSKLLTVFALWAGVKGLMPLLFIMSVVGGLLGVITLFLNKNTLVKKPVESGWIEKAQKGEKDVPYGIAIFLGAVFAFWHTGYIQPNQLMALAVDVVGP